MSLPDLTLPVKAINGYLWETMIRIEPTFVKTYGKTVPIFPISDASSGAASWEDKTYIVYDRMMKFTRQPFPYIKREHILYSVKGNEEDNLLWGSALQYILDRQDDSAQDINDWNRSRTNPYNVYFHSTRAYQTGSSASATGGAQTRDFSNRPFYVTKFVVNCEYHLTDTLESFIA